MDAPLKYYVYPLDTSTIVFNHQALTEQLERLLQYVFHESTPLPHPHPDQAGTEDVKKVISQLSKLRYQLLTDKPMEPIAHGDDTQEWDLVFDRYRKKFNEENPKWFSASWLFAECYMYRKIVEIIRTR